jgi:hypothetical protein
MQRSGSWLEVDQELPVRVKQTIRAQKSMLTIFLHSRSLAAVGLLQQGTIFGADYFIAQVITPLDQLHSPARGDNARRKLCWYFKNSFCHTGRVVVDEMSQMQCWPLPHPLYSPISRSQTFACSAASKNNSRGD